MRVRLRLADRETGNGERRTGSRRGIQLPPTPSAPRPPQMRARLPYARRIATARVTNPRAPDECARVCAADRAQAGAKNAANASAYAFTSAAPINSRDECMASCAAPTSTVDRPVRDAVMGPMVDPHGRSARCT